VPSAEAEPIVEEDLATTETLFEWYEASYRNWYEASYRNWYEARYRNWYEARYRNWYEARYRNTIKNIYACIRLITNNKKMLHITAKFVFLEQRNYRNKKDLR